MCEIVYVKKVDEYDDILKEKHHKIPMFLKKIIYIFKNMFNVITKKKIEDNNLWVLPIQEKCSFNKLESIIKKLSMFNNTYIISNDLESYSLYKLMDKYNISYLKGRQVKKYLSIKILEYINNIQNEEMSNIEVTLLASDISEFNVYLIEKLSKIVRSIKVVSFNIYKFKNLEEKLYNEFGIAIQFSNSYKKSLAKSKIIINLDYNQIDINEYEIFDKAIFINCAEDNIRIKSKLFNGIVINSCNIKLKKEIRERFKKMNIFHKYNSLTLYESLISKEKDFDIVFDRLDEDKVVISSLIGNNGNINKKEIKKLHQQIIL